MSEKLIEAQNLIKWFPVRKGFWGMMFSRRQFFVHAVDGVSLDIRKSEIFGLAGESGSGKTTTGRLMLRLIEPTAGHIFFKENDITNTPERKLKSIRQKLQIIFQDPYESLNPRMTIGDIIAEPLQVQGLASGVELEQRVKNTLEDIELFPPEEFIRRYPHELSGGQRQRVAVGRAFILNPEFVVADEPVSMLDISIRAEVINLMLSLVKKYQTSFLYITHDLALARHICDRIAIMYLGKVMEQGSTEKVIYESLHPYTQALISAVPVPDPTSTRIKETIRGEIPSPINVPPGCRFHTRCPIAEIPLCKEKEPPITDHGDGHLAACHLIGTSSWQKYVASTHKE